MAERWVAADELAGAFFFARWRVGGSSSKHLFPTIAYQLALHIPQLRKAIGLAVEADPAICARALEDQARALIANPFGGLDTEHKPYLVIIDGLDECDNKQTQSRIIKIIFQMLAEHGLPIKFLICSRPEPHIRETFDSLPPYARFRRLILDETFNPGRDIMLYLRDRFSEIWCRCFPNQVGMYPPWPSERELDILVHKASGQFIYAATVIKFVDDEYCHPMEQLRLVLSLSAIETDTSPFADLDALYTFILWANPNTSLLVRILGTYFAIPDPDDNRRHCVSFLDDILGLARGTVRFSLRGLHSVLFIPDSDEHRIRVHHASLHDFLTNPQRAGIFFLDIDNHHEELTWVCLTIVQDSVECPQRYPPAISFYSHQHWKNHFTGTVGQLGLIHKCLKCFRDSLKPERLTMLCCDVKAMTLRFLRIIDFLDTIEEYEHGNSITRDRNTTWDMLLRTLFDPNQDLLKFYEAWGVDQLGDPPLMMIHSSLGIVFQRLYTKSIQNRVCNFVHGSMCLRLRAAEIALQLLMCRTAEVKAFRNHPASLYFSRWPRTHMNWSFASEWCRFLMEAPPAAELLAMVRQLVENGFWIQPKELYLRGLISWLEKFGDEAVHLIRIFDLLWECTTDSQSSSEWENRVLVTETGHRPFSA
ncbi:hypothetical protein C8R44DRAFT_671954 [Mycena epipterygia]|nr:hypothetical protein C8R44DRAFT_671954 [Mycena epipterygia]